MLLTAILIGLAATFYSNHLVSALQKQERKKVALWAEATRKLAEVADLEADLSFLFQVVNDNSTVPVILANEQGEIIAHRNLDSAKVRKPGYLQKQIGKMKQQHDPIRIDFQGGVNFIYYKDSFILNLLKFYPLAVLGIIGAYLLVAYAIFSSTRRAEQNRVWAGMAKETAHQIGTPLSSLLGWIEILKTHEVPQDILDEMSKDVDRLEKITQRFSKIGSAPEISSQNLVEITRKSMNYIQVRSSKKINFQFNLPEEDAPILVNLNLELYEWVIENLLRNAMDAMEGIGEIEITIGSTSGYAFVDVRDTGKGVKTGQWKRIFRPGFTTKKRGWGLGLSLAHRIINEYHDGQIFVKESNLGKGTTIRIKLPHAKD